VSIEVGKFGISMDKAIRVIANAKTASLKDIICSILIIGVNDPDNIMNSIEKRDYNNLVIFFINDF
jgi:hypothetical protein